MRSVLYTPCQRINVSTSINGYSLATGRPRRLAILYRKLCFASLRPRFGGPEPTECCTPVRDFFPAASAVLPRHPLESTDSSAPLCASPSFLVLSPHPAPLATFSDRAAILSLTTCARSSDVMRVTAPCCVHFSFSQLMTLSTIHQSYCHLHTTVCTCSGHAMAPRSCKNRSTATP